MSRTDDEEWNSKNEINVKEVFMLNFLIVLFYGQAGGEFSFNNDYNLTWFLLCQIWSAMT
jgi:hypothetical protein